MATVPIEIILQDAETPVDPTPTPTPESGEETNIIVPNTGTINDAGGIGSSASIILPAIIVVLALGAMVALLVRRQYKRKKANDGAEDYNTKVSKKIISRKEKLATTVSGTIAILAATVLVGNLVMPATKAATNVEPGTAELDTADKITITATREIDSDITVATVKNTSYATANLDFGYKVTASMSEGTTTANLYLDGNTDSPYYIAPVSDGTLTDNTWGYTLSEPTEESSYLSIPLEDTPTTIVKGTDNIVEDKPVDIYYTVQIDKDMPTGTYVGEIEYDLTDNNFPSTLTTMQGMTTEICENTYTPGNQVTDPVPTATLEDIRDHKTYTIAKLADGKCWMTQNLDLDLSTEITLTPADTDVSESWTPENSTLAVDGTSVPGWSNNNTEPYSVNPGDVYYYTSGTDANDTKYNSLENCERDHNDGSCPHYHAGNYYNWSAAVASNDTSEITTQYDGAPDSICPTGWGLPEGPNAKEEYYEEAVNLVKSYSGILEDVMSDLESGAPRYYYLNGGFNNIRMRPLWLNRPGIVYYGSFGQNGEVGRYWSSVISNSGNAYELNFDSGKVMSVGTGARAGAQPVRCVAH